MQVFEKSGFDPYIGGNVNARIRTDRLHATPHGYSSSDDLHDPC
jgi:hypothetical protein